MCSLKVNNPGLLTTIQDFGRIGYGKYGIPRAGAMDELSLQLANILVGNDRYEAALEITLIGPEIEFYDNLIIAITGGNITPKINGKVIDMYSTIYVNRGDVLSFGNRVDGCRAYLALSGGFKVEEVMGSKSSYLRGSIGGYKGRRIMAGDSLAASGDKGYKYIGVRRIPKDFIPKLSNKYTARVIMGPEDDRFTDDGIKTFLNSQYILSNQYDRMGYRLNGAKIQHINGADILSGGITFGAIQVPGHGEPIIMMADRQTTGGYTKIANVISVDLPYLAQLKAGDKVNFKVVTVDKAQRLIRQREERIIEIVKGFEEDGLKISVKKSRNFVIAVNDKKFIVGIQELE